MKPLILIGSDDPDFIMLLGHILRADGFLTVFAGDVDAVLRLAKRKRPHAVLVDCYAEGFAGEICGLLRANFSHAIPVLALIRIGAENLVGELLKVGVDECFIRPVAPVKILDCLRVRVDFSPVQAKGGSQKRSLRYGAIELSLDTRRVMADGKNVHLSPTEFRLLRFLMENPGRVFSREELISAAWPQNVFVDARTVNVHVGRLRRILMAETGTNYIRTVRSAGYALNET